jgi:intermediate cleaving peptidase 55
VDVDFILHQGASKLQDLGKEVAKLRRVKSAAEKQLMMGAATRSARAHAKVRVLMPPLMSQRLSVSNNLQTMRFTSPGMSESEIEAYFQYTCALPYSTRDGTVNSGCERPAYVPVVASG